MRAKDAVGQYGQQVAERYLVESGLTLVARNWRCPDANSTSSPRTARSWSSAK